ncbi:MULTISPECIES: hypothetical protein [Halanaerobium]|jgi:uncharacterized protein YneF (UPF0154 family)|uniref:Ferric reductase like transmembrane component n=1 Tax=Halanaerobium kushneri TaxID=56779 RepID=A0A1N6P9W2_9FIRM|nr:MULTISPECIES: hypothetical protein [Halanaerobium]RCW58709.1 hypothetical protein DFR80_10946 [Halanaerobium sp. ST460_2HS_T2]SIQ01161.1 hypothetical protein SAMN05421834_10113 [Halanaerobium kushneri]
MGQWIIPAGISALTSLVITFLLGIRFFRKVFNLNPRLNLKLHKIFAYLTLILAAGHGLLVYIVYL